MTVLPGRAAPGPSGRSVTLPILCLASAFTVVVAYLVFVRTGWGQRFDYRVFEGRKATNIGMRRTLTAAMRIGTPPGVVLACAMIVISAFRRSGRIAGVIAVASVGLSVTVAEVLKLVLSRPHLFLFYRAPTENTFPSGHSTAVMALALAWVTFAARTGRNPRATLCVVGLVCWVTAMVGSGWHRPCDVLGGLALATTIVTAVYLISSAVAPGALNSPSLHDRVERRPGPSAGTATFAVLVAALYQVAIMNPTRDPRHSLGAYLVGTIVCTGAGAGALVIMARETDSSTRPTATERSHPPSD